MAAKRQLLLELLAKDSTGPATKAAAENIEHVGEKAEDAARATDKLGEQAEETAKSTEDLGGAADEAAKSTDKLGEQAQESAEEVERFGKSNRTAAEHAEALQREIEATERELHQLAIAFAEAETAAERADFSKAIRKNQSDLRKLNKGKSLVEELVPSPAEVEQGFQALAPVVEKESVKLFAGVGEAAGPALAGALVAVSPFIGATISGAIIGAVGLGGVVGGFALAAKDPRVQAAAKSMGASVSAELKDAAKPFVDVSIKGINEVGGAVKKIDFNQIFQDSAKNAQPIIDGVTTAVEALGHALTDVIHNAGPVVKEIGNEIGAIGTTLAHGLESLTDNGKQSADALHQLFMVINGSISTVFALVNGLTEVYGALEKISAGGPTQVLDALAAANANVKDKAVGAAQAVIDAANANNDLADSADAATRASEKQRQALIDLDKQERANVDPLFKLLNTQDQVTAAQKNYNDAVKKHGKSSEEARAAARQLAEASLDEADAVDQVSKTMDGKLTPAMERNLRKAGLNSQQIAAIKEELDRARTSADKFGQLKPVAHISANISGATGPIQHVAALLKSLPKSKHITVTVGTSVAGAVTNLGSLLSHRAGGGPVTKGKAYVVGEKRPELFVPDRDGTIIPSLDRLNGTSAPMSSAGAGSSASASPIVVNLVLDGKVIATQVVDPLRNFVRTKHGGSVQRALGFGAV